MPKNASGQEPTPSQPRQEGIQLVKHCPLCQKEYRDDLITVLEERAGTKLLHLSCPTCGHALLALVVVSKVGMSSVGMMTDLTVPDMKRMSMKECVTEDDILAFHELLRHTPEQFTSTILSYEQL